MASIISAGTSVGTALNLTGDTSGILQLASNNGTTAVTIDASQNVGIGTTTMTGKFNVSGSSYLYGLRISGADTFNSIYQSNAIGISSDNYVTFATGASNLERMRIDSSGNVGIGTSSPAILGGSYKNLVLQGGSTTNGGYFFTQTSDGAQVGQIGVDTGVIYMGARSNHPVAFTTNNTERMRIDSSGNLLVGTTTGVAGQKSITVNAGSGGGSAFFLAYAENAAGKDAGMYMECPGVFGGQIYASRANTQIRVWCSSATSGVSLAASGTSWGTFSDERMKDIIEPITDAADKVSSLRAVIGKYKTDEQDKRRAFLIAQDVQKVLPEAVYVNSKEDDTLNLSYTDVIPLLVAAIKELNAKVDAQAAEIQALKGAK